MIWFTADLHLGHELIIQYCDRPFSNAEHMHSVLMKNFCKKASENDTIYFLGDVAFRAENLKSFLSQIPGKKILIMGNHDKWGVNTYYQCGFSAVLDYAEMRFGQRKLRLNHIPCRSHLEFFRLLGVYFVKSQTWLAAVRKISNEWKKYLPQNNDWCICGHVHGAWKVRGRNINVGVDVWDYSLVGLDEIHRLIQIGSRKG
jgi:calcineurin-like phosphoesterase family protein